MPALFAYRLVIGWLCYSILGGVVLAYEYVPRSTRVRMTAYTHSESDHIEWGRKTAIGTQLRFEQKYNSAASDWSHLPVGTEFRIRGVNRHFVVDDYGSGLVGKGLIDIYFPSKKMMNTWGMRWCDIIITKYGSYEESERILENAVRYSGKWHVKKMLAGIKANAKRTKGKPEYFGTVPEIPTEVQPELMAGMSIPPSQWNKPAPPVVPDPRQSAPPPVAEPVMIADASSATITPQPQLPPMPPPPGEEPIAQAQRLEPLPQQTILPPIAQATPIAGAAPPLPYDTSKPRPRIFRPIHQTVPASSQLGERTGTIFRNVGGNLPPGAKPPFRKTGASRYSTSRFRMLP